MMTFFSSLSPSERETILKLVVEPDAWIQPHIADAARQIAGADPIEHFRQVTARTLEAILALLELDATEPTPAVLIAHLLDPQASRATWDSVREKGKLSPVAVPISMIDRLTYLQTIPQVVRDLQFAGVVAHLRAAA